MKILPINIINFNKQNNRIKGYSSPITQPTDKVSFGAITEIQEERLVANAYKLFSQAEEMKRSTGTLSSNSINSFIQKTKAFIRKQRSVLEKVDFREGFTFEDYRFGRTEITPILEDSRIIINQDDSKKWLNTLHIDLTHNEAVIMLNRKDDRPIIEIVKLK